jgi:hypothetical protein
VTIFRFRRAAFLIGWAHHQGTRRPFVVANPQADPVDTRFWRNPRVAMRVRLVRSLAAVLSIGLVSACAHPDGGKPRTAAATGATQPSWAARAQQHIAAREYWASEAGSGLQAPNRAHGLRTYFDPAGIRVHDRTAGGDAELLRLSLAGVGRGATLAAAAGDEVVPHENRVEIHRPGLVEWYVN